MKRNQQQELFESKRQTVLELELNARYWKAEYEIKHYTLLSEEIKPKYEAYVEAEREKMIKLRAEYEAEMTKVPVVTESTIEDATIV